MTRQDYIELICRILEGSTEHVERPLPDPTFNMVVGYAIEANLDLEAWKMMCYRSLNGQAESIVAEVCAILQPGKPGESADSARQGEAKSKVFAPKDYYDFIKRPDKAWLVDKFFGVKDFGMLFGLPGRGKTFVTLDFIFSLVTAQKLAGQFTVARPCKVLYCTDEGIEGLKARLEAVNQKFGGIKPGMLSIETIVPQLFLDIETGWQQFVNDLAGTSNYDLIVIDTLFNSMVGAKENVADDASVAIHNAKAIRDALNCAILWLHHSNKAGEWPRGTSAWMGSMDLIIQLDAGLMSCFKAKDAPSFAKIGFEITQAGESAIVNWTGIKEESESGGDFILSYMEANPNVKMTTRQISELFGMNQSNLNKKLKEYSGKGLIKAVLPDPNRAASSTNPTHYYFEDKGLSLAKALEQKALL